MEPSGLFAHPAFAADFARLRDVSLDPQRHSLGNAHAHSLAVSARARELALTNDCTSEESAQLVDLGLLHDIGKIEGTTSAARSVELLPRYGVVEPRFVDLVRYHDINLPWHQRPPSDKAWRKMAARLDVHLLCLFMVADRVDCPGGHRANPALVWFLDEAAARGLLLRELRYDVPEEVRHA